MDPLVDRSRGHPQKGGKLLLFDETLSWMRVVHAPLAVSTYERYMLRFYSVMPKFLTCPEIARRSGYSRMHIARLAKEGRLPGERIVTAGGQYRYACTPEMLRWMRLMRTRHRGGLMPPSSLVFRRFRPRSSAAVGRDRGVAIWEIDCLLEEVDERIVEVLSMGPPPTAEEYTSLLQCLRPAVLGLAKREATITKLMSHVPSATAQPKGKSKRSGPLPPVKEARSRTTREPGLE